jgi:hypothetical protein
VTLALLCALLLSLALAAGCASGSEGQPSTETNGAAPATSSADSPETASSVSEEEAREVAEKVLLTLRDFPAGWSQLPPDEDEDMQLDLPPECQAFWEHEEWPGTLVDIDSPEFEGPDDEEVQSGVVIYVNAEAAHQAWVDGKAAVDLCREPVRAALATYLQQGLQAQYPDATIEVAAFTWDWLPFPAYGDESAAMRMSFTVNAGSESFTFHSDFIGWRVDRVEVSLAFDTRTEPPDPNEEQRLAQIIDERLREAAENLD